MGSAAVWAWEGAGVGQNKANLLFCFFDGPISSDYVLQRPVLESIGWLLLTLNGRPLFLSGLKPLLAVLSFTARRELRSVGEGASEGRPTVM